MDELGELQVPWILLFQWLLHVIVQGVSFLLLEQVSGRPFCTMSPLVSAH